MYGLCVVYHLVTIAIILITYLKLLMCLQVQQYSCHVIKSTIIFMSCDQKYSYIHVSLQLLFTDSSIHNIIIYYNLLMRY